MERTLKELQKDKKMLKTAAMTDEGLNGAANKECAAEVLKEQNTTRYGCNMVNSLPYESVNTWEELMGAYFSKFFPPYLISEQRREITNSKQGKDENMYTARKNLAEYNIRPSESSGRNGRVEESRMNELNKLLAIEAKLDALIHWMNERKSN